MSINLKTRGLVFATFFGSCVIIGLLVAALTTEYWIEAEVSNFHTCENRKFKQLFARQDTVTSRRARAKLNLACSLVQRIST